jgi:hypothetical protein
MASSASIVSWYTKPLIGISLQVIFLSFLFTFYNVDVSLKPTIKWATENVLKVANSNYFFLQIIS